MGCATPRQIQGATTELEVHPRGCSARDVKQTKPIPSTDVRVNLACPARWAGINESGKT